MVKHLRQTVGCLINVTRLRTLTRPWISASKVPEQTLPGAIINSSHLFRFLWGPGSKGLALRLHDAQRHEVQHSAAAPRVFVDRWDFSQPEHKLDNSVVCNL